MTADLIPRSYLDLEPSAASGVLARLPAGVEFGRSHFQTTGEHLSDGISSPVLVMPRKPEHPFLSQRGYLAWSEEYTPDRKMVVSAIYDLADMARLSGAPLRAAVDVFARQYGVVAGNVEELWNVPLVVGGAPTYISRSRHSLWPPLWLFHHEAKTLAGTLALYYAVRNGDIEGIRVWYRERGVDDSDVWHDAWYNVLFRIVNYLSLTQIETDFEDRLQEFRATSLSNLMPAIPTQRIVARTILGAIYAELFQIVTDQRPARRCAARGCGRIFIPGRSDQVYCTDACGNTERVRRFRERQGKAGE